MEEKYIVSPNISHKILYTSCEGYMDGNTMVKTFGTLYPKSEFFERYGKECSVCGNKRLNNIVQNDKLIIECKRCGRKLIYD